MEMPSIGGSRRQLPAMDLRIPVAAGASVAIGALAVFWPDNGSYTPWSGEVTDWAGLARWFLSAWTEPVFYTSAFAGVGLLIGAMLAYCLATVQSRWRGIGLACGSGLWPWTVASSALGLVLSNLVWGWTLRETGVWQPTFVPVVSIAPTVVLVYGAGWRPALAGAVLSAVIVAPLSIAATHFLCRPLGLPPVAGVTGGMAVGAFLSFAVCRLLPFHPAQPNADGAQEVEAPGRGFLWALRRILADFSEAQFFGNEWASIGLILGALLASFIAPGVPAYGSAQLLMMIAGQGVAAMVGMALWHRKWAQNGFYPTFVPIVSVVPAATLAFNGSAIPIMGSAVLGALIGPPLAAAISARLPEGYHPFIGNVASMAISTAAIIPVLGLLHTAS
ncbi:hypothetical protein [Phyllobacterium zundukense]|uniref:Uncharacterized protein n=1 Tax=Phyllobacterium zundukense TaxID=1867719 RepID=A0ACD4CYN3_9HYPH|nr:hypothetical protein [Phyllobacterium zundukense]UXN58747.1 hypothetical protein N8E88_12340 [Phyllobacterium zundukense]